VSAATDLLRPGLLEGTSVLVAGGGRPAGAKGPAATTEATGATGPASTAEPIVQLGGAIGAACSDLGAEVHLCASDAVDEAALDQRVTAILTESGGLDLLVVDGAELFAQGGLRNCLDAAWNMTRAVVNLAFLATEPSSSNRPEPGSPTRRVIYLAPTPSAGEHAGAACAGLENLGRTLSTEWARHGITLVTIAPGEATAAGEVAALCAYLASPAGAYFSGCLLDLRGP
jgi:NAD(P)-dependent dehydrogenase (short-subunit alcohol dehydrogenase family)